MNMETHAFKVYLGNGRTRYTVGLCHGKRIDRVSLRAFSHAVVTENVASGRGELHGMCGSLDRARAVAWDLSGKIGPDDRIRILPF